MSTSLEDQLAAYVRTHSEDGVLLDTNVLLLLLIFKFNPELVGKERLRAYELRDAELLSTYVGCFKKILTTPHVLAETSNFARQMTKGRMRTELFEWLYPIFCEDGEHALSQTTPAGREIDGRLFVGLGLTDSVLAASAGRNLLLLTADLDLHVATVSQGGHSINFTHMREAAGFL